MWCSGSGMHLTFEYDLWTKSWLNKTTVDVGPNLHHRYIHGWIFNGCKKRHESWQWSEFWAKDIQKLVSRFICEGEHVTLFLRRLWSLTVIDWKGNIPENATWWSLTCQWDGFDDVAGKWHDRQCEGAVLRWHFRGHLGAFKFAKMRGKWWISRLHLDSCGKAMQSIQNSMMQSIDIVIIIGQLNKNFRPSFTTFSFVWINFSSEINRTCHHFHPLPSTVFRIQQWCWQAKIQDKDWWPSSRVGWFGCWIGRGHNMESCILDRWPSRSAKKDFWSQMYNIDLY